MEKNRLESFSDGVIAIIITIMVLQLGIPHNHEIHALYPIIPIFLGYVLSFIYVGIYWNNHHNLLHNIDKVSGRILWINLIFLFWLSLFPFTTAWMAENQFTPWPTALYGIVLLLASIFYYILKREIIKNERKKSNIQKTIKHTFKEKVSMICYIIAICFALIMPHFSQFMYAIVALLLLVPDHIIDNLINQTKIKKTKNNKK